MKVERVQIMKEGKEVKEIKQECRSDGLGKSTSSEDMKKKGKERQIRYENKGKVVERKGMRKCCKKKYTEKRQYINKKRAGKEIQRDSAGKERKSRREGGKMINCPWKENVTGTCQKNVV